MMDKHLNFDLCLRMTRTTQCPSGGDMCNSSLDRGCKKSRRCPNRGGRQEDVCQCFSRQQEYLPTVPMRTVGTEIAQGTIVPEGFGSPLSRDLAFHKSPPHPHPSEDDHRPSATLSASVREHSAAQSIHEDTPSLELEELLHSPAEAAAWKEEEVQPRPCFESQKA